MTTPCRTSAPIRIYHLKLPLTWVWQCRPCGRHTGVLDWQQTLENALDHLHTVHACPSLRASGEPCDSHCADCGGRMWIK